MRRRVGRHQHTPCNTVTLYEFGVHHGLVALVRGCGDQLAMADTTTRTTTMATEIAPISRASGPIRMCVGCERLRLAVRWQSCEYASAQISCPMVALGGNRCGAPRGRWVLGTEAATPAEASTTGGGHGD